MGIRVEIDKVILSGEPFDVVLAVAEGEGAGAFLMKLEIDGVERSFAMQLGPPLESVAAPRQVVNVAAERIWTVVDWGTAAPGALLEVKVNELAASGRSGSDRAAVMPSA